MNEWMNEAHVCLGDVSGSFVGLSESSEGKVEGFDELVDGQVFLSSPTALDG